MLVQCVCVSWSYCQPLQPALNPVWCWSSVYVSPGAIVNLFNLPQPSVMLVQCVCVSWSYCQPLQPALNPVWCWSSVYVSPGAIVNLFNLPLTQCDVGPVCMCLLELLSTSSTCLNPVWCWSSVYVSPGAIVNLFNLPQPSVMLVQCVCVSWSYCQPLQPASTQCDVGPVCMCLLELLSTSSTCLNPVWCWSSVYVSPGAIVNLFNLPLTQCDVGPVCMCLLELLSTSSTCPQPSVMLVQCVCVSWSYCQPLQPALNPVW